MFWPSLVALAYSLANGASASSLDAMGLMQVQLGSRAVDAEKPSQLDEGQQTDSKPHDPEHNGDWLAPAALTTLKEGEVLVGDMLCSWQNVGLRLTVKNWPKLIRVYAFPQPERDWMSFRWCPSLHKCTAGFDAQVNINEDVMNITPVKGGQSNMSLCEWPTFNLIGSFWGSGYEMGGNGALEKFGGPNNEPFFKAVKSDHFPERFTKKCRMLHEAILGSKGGGGVTCHKFQVKKCEGRPAAKGEKVLYFMSGVQSDAPGETDPPVGHKGRREALSLKENPIFRKAFGDEEDRRAEIIYVAPTARAMETAALAFGTEGVEIVPDIRLKDKTNHIIRENGEFVIRNMTDHDYLLPETAWHLMDKYRALYKDWHGYQEEKWFGGSDGLIKNFFEMLLQRPEKRVVIVGHHNVMNHAYGNIQGPGGVQSRILLKDGSLSHWFHQPNCFGSL